MGRRTKDVAEEVRSRWAIFHPAIIGLTKSLECFDEAASFENFSNMCAADVGAAISERCVGNILVEEVSNFELSSP